MKEIEIYGVVASFGKYEDYYEIVEKLFTSEKSAYKYLREYEAKMVDPGSYFSTEEEEKAWDDAIEYAEERAFEAFEDFVKENKLEDLINPQTQAAKTDYAADILSDFWLEDNQKEVDRIYEYLEKNHPGKWTKGMISERLYWIQYSKNLDYNTAIIRKYTLQVDDDSEV